MRVTVNKTEYLDEQGLNELWNKIKEYVALHGGDGEGIDLSQYTTKEELATELSKYYDKTEIDALLSNLSPDVDLSNYYTKQETYNKTEVDNLIESSGGGEVDLSDYYTKTEVDTKLEEVVAGDIDLTNYYTKAETYNKEEIDNKIVSNTYEEYSLDEKYIKRTDVLWDTIPTYSPKTALVKPLGSDYNVYINTTSGDTLYYNDYISYGSSNSEVGTVKDCYIIGTGDGSKQPKYETQGIEYIEKLPGFTSVALGTWTFGKYHVQKRKVYTLNFEETIYSDETYYMNNADLPDVTEWERDNKVTNPEAGYVYTYKRTKVGEKTFKALEFYEPGVYSFYNKNSKSNTIQCIDSKHNTFESIELNNSTVGQGGMIPNFVNVSSVTIGSISSNSNDEKYTWVYYIDPDDFNGLITVKGDKPYNEILGDNEKYEGKYEISFTVKQADKNGSIIDSTDSKECNIYLNSPLLERQYIRLSDLSIYRNISKEIEKGIEEAYTIENPVENLSEWLSDTLVNSDGGEGQDGFSPIATVTQTSTGAIITITDKNGTTSATITNGEDGQDGTNGTNGTDGEDGFSPTIVENAGNNSTTYKLDITTKTSTFTTPNLKGQDGTGGDVDLSNYYTKSETYSKTEVDGLIPTVPTNVSAFTNDANYLKYQVVSTLPDPQEEGVLYLVTN